LADYIEEKIPEQLRSPTRPDVNLHLAPSDRTVLRPPGAARRERDFLSKCFRSGACADACPAHAIKLLESDDPEMRGSPYIDADAQACVICDELACMKVCPSGALSLVGRLEIRIGLARVTDDVCVRSRGENCTICIDKCPIGVEAI